MSAPGQSPASDGSGRASRTARAVAAGRAIGYRHLHDPLAIRFLSAPERLAVGSARQVAARVGGADAVALATAGLSLHAALRMAAIDAEVTAAVVHGCGQVVVVGAGFDTRVWRLASLAGAAVWEVDLPGTQQAKREGLGDLSGTADVTFAAADLAAQSLPAAMAGSGHDPTVPTAWVWEAVAPYLPADAVSATLEGIRTLSANGSHLAMTFAHPKMLGPRALMPITGALARIAFRAIGEPILSAYDEWDIASLLSHHGFAAPLVTAAPDWARAAHLRGRPDPLGAERLVTACVDAA